MNIFLEKIALTRLVKEISKGGFNTNISELVNKGLLRSKSIYAKGMKKGNEALAKKYNVVISKPKIKDTSQG